MRKSGAFHSKNCAFKDLGSYCLEEREVQMVYVRFYVFPLISSAGDVCIRIN
jgi:hypothetical protein